MRSHGNEPRKIVTDKLRRYGVAHRALIPETIHVTDRYANKRAEQLHEGTRVRERDGGITMGRKALLLIANSRHLWSSTEVLLR